MISPEEIRTRQAEICAMIDALSADVSAMKAEVRGIASTWPPGFGDVEDAVSKAFGISLGDLHGPRRFAWVSEPRHALMLMLSEKVKGKPETIGKFLGGRNRGTVVNGIARAKALAFSDPAYRAKIEKLRSEIK